MKKQCYPLFLILALAACNGSNPAPEEPTTQHSAPILKGDFSDTFFIAAKNPISIQYAQPQQLVLIKSTVKWDTLEANRYTIQPVDSQLAQVVLRDTATQQEFNLTLPLRRLPDPAVLLGDKYAGGEVAAADFSAQVLLAAKVTSVPMETDCHVQSYRLLYTAIGKKEKEIKGQSEKTEGKAWQAVSNTQAGDRFVFSEIKVRCLGDSTARLVPDLVFTIK